MSTLVLTPQFLKLNTGEFDLATIFQLLLARRRIRSPLESLERCVNLRFLDLSNNEITTLGNFLTDLALLEYLDVSANKLTRVDGLPTCDISGANNLRTLRFQNNPIARLVDLEGVQGQRALEHVSFQAVDNSQCCPVCLNSQYRTYLLDARMSLPTLRSLDYHRLHAPDLNDKIERMRSFHNQLQTSNSVDESESGAASTEEGDNSTSLGHSAWLSSSATSSSDDDSASRNYLVLSPTSRRAREAAQDKLLAAVKLSKEAIRDVYAIVDVDDKN